MAVDLFGYGVGVAWLYAWFVGFFVIESVDRWVGWICWC